MPLSTSTVPDSSGEKEEVFTPEESFPEYSGKNVATPPSPIPEGTERTPEAASQDEENIIALRRSCYTLIAEVAEVHRELVVSQRELEAARQMQEKKRQELVDFKSAMLSVLLDRAAPRYEKAEIRFKRLRAALLDLLADS